MRKIITTIAVQIASLASILGLYFTIIPFSENRPLWHWALVTVGVAAFIYLICIEINDHFRTTPKVFRTHKKINAYMKN